MDILVILVVVELASLLGVQRYLKNDPISKFYNQGIVAGCCMIIALAGLTAWLLTTQPSSIPFPLWAMMAYIVINAVLYVVFLRRSSIHKMSQR